MAYAGRTSQEPETFNFGGLNLKASAINLKDGEAQDIDNFDIDISGTLTTRKGYSVLQSIFPGPIEFFNNYFTSTGQEIFILIANHVIYEASTIAGPYVSRNGGFFPTGTNWEGTYIADSYILANGVDAPLISKFGSDVVSLESASIVSQPTSLSGVVVGAAGATNYFYKITSVTPRGETDATPAVLINLAPASLTTSNYIQLSWVPAVGALSYNVYRSNGTNYVLIGNTISSTISDTGLIAGSQVPPGSNTAYNTPNDWNLNGQPEGVAVLARGRNQHLIAWRKNTVWAAAYGTALDWFKTNDAFSFTVQGGEDNSIKTVITLYDFTVMFSATNSFVYTGSSSADLNQSKILHTGCVSPYSVVPVGDDIYIWSQYGPTTLSRILQGADVQTTAMSVKVNPLVYDQTNRSAWDKIAGWHDIKNQRVCWAYPSTSSSTNDKVLVWNYTIMQADGSKGAWSKFSGWSIVNAILSSSTGFIYGVTNVGNVCQLHSGSTDAGTIITATYKSSWYDLRTWLKKRLLWLDLIVDAAYYYNIFVNTAWEFNRPWMLQTHNVSNGSTDSYAIETIGDYNEHRIYTQGNGQHFQFVFMSSTPCRIVGWRPDTRVKGTR